MSKLKACPFCGSNVGLHTAKTDSRRKIPEIVCHACKIKVVNKWGTGDGAVSAWNNRHDDPDKERMRSMLESIMEQVIAHETMSLFSPNVVIHEIGGMAEAALTGERSGK